MASMGLAVCSHLLYPVPALVFLASALALILLSKFIGDATEHYVVHVGERLAGLFNVTLSNLAELIIVFVAIREGKIALVHAGIVGSIMGNILLIMGLSVYFGCRKHSTMKYNHDTAGLYINQIFLVGSLLFLPTLFDSHITESRQQHISYLLAVLLVLAYVYFYVLSMRDPRFHVVREQERSLDRGWTKKKCTAVLAACGTGAFFMSELLIGEVEEVAAQFHLSHEFIGFVVLPLLGNIAEHLVAVRAAVRGMTELSLAVAVGSASQVGMIVAPAAVLFGLVLGNPFTLHFAHLPLTILILSLIGGYLVLRDDSWNINEGVTLLVLYGGMVVGFFFVR
jgi:Ca2+:H+ antiporter